MTETELERTLKERCMRYEDRISQLEIALNEIAESEGLTLLGCNCDNYMNCACGDTAYRVFERGANRAFNQLAGVTKNAVSAGQEKTE